MHEQHETFLEPPSQAESVRLCLLGPPILMRGGARIALPFERRTQLLAFVTLRRMLKDRNQGNANLLFVGGRSKKRLDNKFRLDDSSSTSL